MAAYLLTITDEEGDTVFETSVETLTEQQVAQVAAAFTERDKGDESPDVSERHR